METKFNVSDAGSPTLKTSNNIKPSHDFPIRDSISASHLVDRNLQTIDEAEVESAKSSRSDQTGNNNFGGVTTPKPAHQENQENNLENVSIIQGLRGVSFPSPRKMSFNFAELAELQGEGASANHPNNLNETVDEAADYDYDEPERCFKCDICGKAYDRKSSLALHMSRLHTYRRLKKPKYTCDTCGKILKSESTFENHRIVHSDVRLFSCEMCELTFKRPGGLNSHLNTKKHLAQYAECKREEKEKQAKMQTQGLLNPDKHKLSQTNQILAETEWLPKTGTHEDLGNLQQAFASLSPASSLQSVTLNSAVVASASPAQSIAPVSTSVSCKSSPLQVPDVKADNLPKTSLVSPPLTQSQPIPSFGTPSVTNYSQMATGPFDYTSQISRYSSMEDNMKINSMSIPGMGQFSPMLFCGYMMPPSMGQQLLKMNFPFPLPSTNSLPAIEYYKSKPSQTTSSFGGPFQQTGLFDSNAGMFLQQLLPQMSMQTSGKFAEYQSSTVPASQRITQTCTKCPAKFNTDEELRSHLHISHPTSANGSWNCPVCFQAMTSPEELTQHFASKHGLAQSA